MTVTKETSDLVLDPEFPIAIFGMGVSGRGAVALLDKQGFSWVAYDSINGFTDWKKEYASLAWHVCSYRSTCGKVQS